MAHTYADLLKTSYRVNWCIEDVIGTRSQLDFSKPFLPETFARAAVLPFLSSSERLMLNHIRTRGYLAMFELVEDFVVPFIGQQADSHQATDSQCRTSLQNFVVEENKHREVFRQFRAEIDSRLGVVCESIGPVSDIVAAVLDHSPLALTVTILGLELMSQSHYLESIRDQQDLDAVFKELLRHHWIEEVQHAKLDALLLRDMVQHSDVTRIGAAIDEFFAIGALFDHGFSQQVFLDLSALERLRGHTLTAGHQEQFIAVQHQALRWTFLGSTMRNPNFLAAMETLGDDARRRVEQAAPTFS